MHAFGKHQHRIGLVSATLVMLLGVSGQESGKVQENAPPQTAQPPPAAQFDKAIFRATISSDQLGFLTNLAGLDSDQAVRDKKYRKLLHNAVPNCVFHYGSDMPLFDALDMVLKGSTLPVQIRKGRYVMVSGRSGPYLSGRGFMWMDMQEGIALGGFYFHPTNGEPTPTVTIFSKQVRERTLALSQLPPAFAEDFSRWLSESYIKPITTRYFITGFNEKILLEHDEDFCAPKDGPTPSPQAVCER